MADPIALERYAIMRRDIARMDAQITGLEEDVERLTAERNRLRAALHELVERDRPADEIIITPAMLQAGQDRIGDIGEASSAYLAAEAFLAMMAVALADGVYTYAQ